MMQYIVKFFILLIIVSQNIAFASKDRTVHNYIHNKDWDNAKLYAKACKDPVLMKIFLSQSFLDSSYSKTSFKEITDFINKNPNWFQVKKLKTRAESLITNSTSPTEVVRWFESNPVLTGQGYKQHAMAASKVIKNKPELSTIIKNGWIYGEFSQVEADSYRKKFASYLSEKEHIQKIDHILWQADTNRASRYLHLVSAMPQKIFRAQIALIEKNKDAEVLFAAIPEKLYSSGLIYNFLKFKKTTVPDQKSIRLFSLAKSDKTNSDKWTNLQLYYAREFFDQKDFASAYKLLKVQLAINAEDISEVNWLAGWVSLRYLKKPELAKNHFEKFMANVSTPISLSRGNYWLGRCLEARKEHKQALEFYKNAKKFGHTFYGQLASVAFGDNKISLPSDYKLKKPLNQIIKENELLAAINLLVENKLYGLATVYAKNYIHHTKTTDKDTIAASLELITKSNDLHLTVSVAKVASQKHVFIKKYLYPTPDYNIKNLKDAALTYSVIKQESVFDKNAVSSANAYGLMQLIEPTACAVAKELKTSCSVSHLTKNANYNVMLGTHHLKSLYKKRDGSHILLLASYNADPKAVTSWVKRFGDPRKASHLYNVIDWMELMPYGETRNYVQRVLENLQIYTHILNKDTALKLKHTLTSGI